MKENNGEKLFSEISQIDDEILKTALETDNAEKLQALTSRATKTNRRLIRTLALVAATVALISVIAFVLPSLIKTRTPPKDTPYEDSLSESIPPSPPSPPSVRPTAIDTLDKLNFYGGLLSVIRANGDGRESMNMHVSPTLLSSMDGEWPTPDYKENIYYYPLDEIGSFEIYWATYFSIRLDPSVPFLCELMGSESGEVEVVITKNNVENMITFHKDGRFYSCIINSQGALFDEYFDEGTEAYSGGWLEFHTGKYIDGEHLVKNYERENYSFIVVYEGTPPTALNPAAYYGKITYFGVMSDRDSTRIPLSVIEGSTRNSNVTYSFSVNEIAEYFVNADGETLTPKPPSPPEIYDDACLYYYLVDGEYYEVSGFYSPARKNLVIPSELFGYPVKGICSHAFNNYKYLESVTIPDSVEYIGDYAFYNCTSLKEINLPDGVRLGRNVFGSDDEAQ